MQESQPDEISERNGYASAHVTLCVSSCTGSPAFIYRSAQPCIPPGSLNRVPASAGVKTGFSSLPGDR